MCELCVGEITQAALMTLHTVGSRSLGFYAADVFRPLVERISNKMATAKARLCAFADGCTLGEEGRPAPTHRKSSYCKAHRKIAHAAWWAGIQAQNAERQARYGKFLTLTELALADARQASEQGADEEPFFVRVWPATTSYAHFLYARQFATKLIGQSGVMIAINGRDAAEGLAKNLLRNMADLAQDKVRITFTLASKVVRADGAPVSELEE